MHSTVPFRNQSNRCGVGSGWTKEENKFTALVLSLLRHIVHQYRTHMISDRDVTAHDAIIHRLADDHMLEVHSPFILSPGN